MDTTQTITHLSLCAGYGGIDLGLRRVVQGLRTCAYVEIEAFPCANLVAKMQENLLDAAPVWSDIKTFDARPFRGKVDILSGGFPCQPFSHAGQRKGTEDPRHLFPDIERIIMECNPNIVFLENVEGIIPAKYQGETDTSVLQYVLGRMEKMGYRTEAGVFSAIECGAPHQRKRVFICGVSNARCDDETTRRQREALQEGSNEWDVEGGGGCDARSGLLQETRCCSRGSNTLCSQEAARLLGSSFPSRPEEDQHYWEAPRTIGSEEVITAMGGSAYGVADGNMVRNQRIDSLRALGNGVVPATAARAFVILMDRLGGQP